MLCSTGLFESFEFGQDIEELNNYTQYKHGFPHLRTTGWVYPPQTVVIFPAALFGLDPIDKVIIQPTNNPTVHISKEVSGLSREDIANLPLPRLAPLIAGLAKRYLDTADDMSMIAVEQLVDGMNLDECWVQKHLGDYDPAPGTLVMGRVRSKKSRIDYYSENEITCFVRDEEEAKNVRSIPGFE